MKKFVFKALVFFSMFVVICWFIELSGFYAYLTPGKLVRQKIALSKKHIDGAEVILLGDSVAGSLYKTMKPGENGVINLACNQALDVIGHYFLLNNSLKKNQNIKKVVFFFNPFSFSNNIDHVYSYNNFIKPFYKREYINLYTETAKKQVKNYPLYFLARFPPVAITYFTPGIDSEESSVFLSEISCEYLRKFQELADEKGFEFEVLSPPIRISREKEVQALKIEYAKEKCNIDLINKYFDKIVYSDDKFYQDDVHFKAEYYTTGRKLISELAGLESLNY